MAIVLASPGTPSTRMWPRASSATTSRSSRWSWPTMTFLTSYSTRSIGPAAVEFAGPVSIGVLRALGAWLSRAAAPAAPPAASMGTARPMPDERLVIGRVEEGGDDAHHLAAPVEQRPARVPGIDRGIELDQPGDGDPLSGARNVRSRPEMTPADSEPNRPYGLPDRVRLAAFPDAAGSPRIAGAISAGGVERGGPRCRSSGSSLTIVGARARAVREGHLDAVASSTTWRLVRMSPARLTTTPLPMPASGDLLPAASGRSVSMRTSDGRTA